MILRDNISYLAPRVFWEARNETEWKLALCKRSGVGAETIRRIMRTDGAPRLDNVEAIAAALGISLSMLLDAGLVARLRAGESGQTPRA